MNSRLFSVIILVALATLAACHTTELMAVSSEKAPKAIGPYSQAVKVGGLIFCSGQIGLTTAGTLAGNDIATQTRQALNNLKAVLEAAGADMNSVTKVTVYLKDLNDYTTVNDIYKDYFTGIKPARAAVQVARLPKDALIEIDCIATSRK